MKRAILIAGLFFSSFHAFAADCPVQFGDEAYLKKVGAAIRATKSCEAGAAVAEVCSLGASGDEQIALEAERKCDRDFRTKLSAVEKQIYRELQTRCDIKYETMKGTMYISANAFCRLQVARLYSELFTPAE